MDSAERDIPAIGELRAQLDAAGIHPQRRMGQNFLIDKNLIRLCARAAELTPETLAIEVGAGPGTLTRALAEEAGWVLTIELDRRLAAFAQDHLSDLANVTVLEGDALAGKSSVNPELMAQAESLRRAHGLRRTVLAANLPYNIATPLIADLLIGDTSIERFVVTVQQEVAERLCAGPGSGHFGWVSVLVASMCEAKIVRKLGPHVFWPRPQVTSAIVQLDRRDLGPRREVVLAAVPVVRELFNHRRKKVRHTLHHQVGLNLAACDALEKDYPLDERAEKLPHEKLIDLAAEAGRLLKMEM